MSSCDELFQRRQRLIQERQKVEADLARINGLKLSTGIPDEEMFSKAVKRQAEILDSAENQAVAAEGVANPTARENQTNIGANQPVNFQQKLRYYPEEFVNDYSQLSRSLLAADRELNPGEYNFLRDADANEQARVISEEFSNREFTVDQALQLINSLRPNELDIVERTFRLRWWHDVSKRAYLDNVEAIGDFMDANPNAAVPAELTSRAFNGFKLSLMAERQYDYIRNTWSRQGRAMQGRDFEDALNLADGGMASPDVLAKEEFDFVDVAKVSEQEYIAVTPQDLTEEQSVARIIKAADLNKSNPTEAMRQLELEINSIRIQGTDPRKRLDPKRAKDSQWRLVNLLVKDSQLANERTQALDLGSNTVMALYGPYRTFYENLLYKPVGTSFTDNFMDAWQAQWKGWGAAFEQVRAAGREVFMDAWRGNPMFFSSNIETYNKFHQPVEERIAELEGLMNVPVGNLLSYVNPARYRRRLHAAFRLWAYDKTGSPAMLRPGLTALAAKDNVSGLFYHTFKLRNELEMKARRDGVQLNLTDRKTANDWIENEMAESFYKLQPTERQIIAYRKENHLSPDLMSDTEVAQEIMESRVRETYGGPAPVNQESFNASSFSEEMRFQKPPGEGNPGAGLYQAINTFRRRGPLEDALVPYLQSPFAGASLDFTALGAGPLVDYLRHVTGNRRLTPAEMRRSQANLIMAGHVYLTYVGLSATGAIIGNGPTDPQARQQWLAKLKAEGKKPNSIFGVQLIGGLPIVSTLFLLEDIRLNAFEYGLLSKYDEQNLGQAAIAVLAGHLTRTTSLGQMGQLMQILSGDQYGQREFGNLASYVGSGQLPGIGPIRSLERVGNTRLNQLYQERKMTQQELELFEPGFLEKMESELRRFAYGVSPATAVFGGKYRDKDWLGTDIRLPWGFGMGRYLSHRFFPHLHPNDKVYAELQMLDLLNPPEPLMTRTLEGVPMSDDLQKTYNDTYGAIVAKPELPATVVTKDFEGIKTTISTKFRTAVKLPNGLKFKKSQDIFTFDFAPLLDKHAQGKRFIDAARSLMNDPIYKGMQDDDSLTSDPGVKDKPKRQLRSGGAYQMMAALKAYYGALTTAELRRNENDDPELTRWAEREKMLDDQVNLMDKQKLESLTGVLGGAE